VLIKQLTGDKWEEIELVFLGLLMSLVLSDLVLDLLLVIEEKKLVFENFTAAHLHMCLFLITVSDSRQVLIVCFHLHATLGLLNPKILTHFA